MQGFYEMPMAQPQGLGYAPQPQAPSQDMFGDTAFGAQQQPAGVPSMLVTPPCCKYCTVWLCALNTLRHA